MIYSIETADGVFTEYDDGAESQGDMVYYEDADVNANPVNDCEIVEMTNQTLNDYLIKKYWVCSIGWIGDVAVLHTYNSNVFGDFLLYYRFCLDKNYRRFVTIPKAHWDGEDPLSDEYLAYLVQDKKIAKYIRRKKYFKLRDAFELAKVLMSKGLKEGERVNVGKIVLSYLY